MLASHLKSYASLPHQFGQKPLYVVAERAGDYFMSPISHCLSWFVATLVEAATASVTFAATPQLRLAFVLFFLT